MYETNSKDADMSFYDTLKRVNRGLRGWAPSPHTHLGLRPFPFYRRPRKFDLWIGGFPRSGHAYAARIVGSLVTDPKKTVACLHRPLPIIQALRKNKPGLFLIRNPGDAVIAWTVFTGCPLDRSFRHYIDFHRALRPHLDRLLVFDFEQITRDFQIPAERFNAVYGPLLTLREPAHPLPHVLPKGIKHECSAAVENHWEELRKSVALQELLQKANRYYLLFRDTSPCA